MLKEAASDDFKAYAKQVKGERQRHGRRADQARPDRIVSGRTEAMFLLDLRAKQSPEDAEAALGRAHITVNKNAIPNDRKNRSSPPASASAPQR